nr:hypothetical protein [Herbiconiux sp. KACC 21604]
MWINPDHVVSLVPKLSRDETHHILRVEIKLVGSPAFDAWLGTFKTGDEANAGWAAFLGTLSLPPSIRLERGSGRSKDADA